MSIDLELKVLGLINRYVVYNLNSPCRSGPFISWDDAVALMDPSMTKGQKEFENWIGSTPWV
jgi:hypothetical protein